MVAITARVATSPDLSGAQVCLSAGQHAWVAAKRVHAPVGDVRTAGTDA